MPPIPCKNYFQGQNTASFLHFFQTVLNILFSDLSESILNNLLYLKSFVSALDGDNFFWGTISRVICYIYQANSRSNFSLKNSFIVIYYISVKPVNFSIITSMSNFTFSYSEMRGELFIIFYQLWFCVVTNLTEPSIHSFIQSSAR